MMNSFGNYSTWGGAQFAGFAFLGVIGVIIGIALFVLVLALKGYALWFAARRGEKGWFIAMLIVNTAGILELVYLVFIVKLWPKIYSGSKTKSASAPTSSANTHDNNNGPKAN